MDGGVFGRKGLWVYGSVGAKTRSRGRRTKRNEAESPPTASSHGRSISKRATSDTAPSNRQSVSGSPSPPKTQTAKTQLGREQTFPRVGASIKPSVHLADRGRTAQRINSMLSIKKQASKNKKKGATKIKADPRPRLTARSSVPSIDARSPRTPCGTTHQCCRYDVAQKVCMLVAACPSDDAFVSERLCGPMPAGRGKLQSSRTL